MATVTPFHYPDRVGEHLQSIYTWALNWEYLLGHFFTENIFYRAFTWEHLLGHFLQRTFFTEHLLGNIYFDFFYREQFSYRSFTWEHLLGL